MGQSIGDLQPTPDRSVTEARAYRARIYTRYLNTYLRRAQEMSPAEIAREGRRFDACFRDLLPADLEASILEVGCGTGSFLRYLSSRGYRHCIGVDVAPQQVEGASIIGANVVERDALEYLRGQRESFDCIVAIDFLEHLRKIEVLDFLDAAEQALRPGGVIVLQTLNAEWPFFGGIMYGDFTHETAFTSHSMRQILNAAGFTHVRVVPARDIVTGLLSGVRWVLWRIERAVFNGTRVFTQNLIAAGRKAPERDTLQGIIPKAVRTGATAKRSEG